MNKWILVAALALIAFNAHASSLTVSDRASLLAALAGPADAILATTGGYGPVAVSRSVALLAAAGAEPRATTVTLRANGETAPTASCEQWRVTGWIDAQGFLVRGCTVGDSILTVRSSRPGITSDALVRENVVRWCPSGILLINHAPAIGNVVEDCAGDGIREAPSEFAYDRGPDLIENRIARVGGYGIYTVQAVRAESNVVLHAGRAGISAPSRSLKRNSIVRWNTVAYSGEAGIDLREGGDPQVGPAELYNNALAFNAGPGIGGAASGACNGLWMNGVAPMLGVSGNVYTDPQFCGAEDFHVATGSPYLGACGQIGAFGEGCPARSLPTAHIPLGNDPTEFGVRSQGRIAMVTLAGPERATLELLDVSGRRVSRTQVAGGPVTLSPPAGVYFLRLTQGAHVSTAKAVMMR